MKEIEHFGAKCELLHKELWTPEVASEDLFKEQAGVEGHIFQITIENDNRQYEVDCSGPRLSLNNSFYHSLYPRLYALAVAMTMKM